MINHVHIAHPCYYKSPFSTMPSQKAKWSKKFNKAENKRKNTQDDSKGKQKNNLLKNKSISLY